MSLHLRFLENLEPFSFDIDEDEENINKQESIQKFEVRFSIFWEKFKVSVLEGETSFYMPVDNEYHLPYLLAIKDIVKTLDETKTIENHEDMVLILREMKDNQIGIEIVSKNGGLSFVRLVPESLIYDEYTIIDLPVLEP